MRRLFGRTLRGRLTVAAVIVAALTLVVLTVTFNVLVRQSLRADVENRLHTRAQAALATVRVTPGGLRTSETAGDATLDSGVWIFDGTRAIESPRADERLSLAAQALAGAPRGSGPAPGNNRLYALPVVEGGRRLGTIVTAASLSAYQHSVDLVVIASVVFALVVLLATAALAWGVTGAALRPVDEMTVQAEDWSEHDVHHRFGAADRPQELDRLAHTFDALLDRIAASLRQEQRLSAELSHELRTPLAKVIAEADLLLRRPRPVDEQRESLTVIRRSAERMTGILETLMAAAREQADVAPGRCDAVAAAGRAAEHARPQAQAAGITVRAPAPNGSVPFAGVAPEVAERVLGPVLDNACRHARSAVTITVREEAGQVVLDVRDDGPGVPAQDLERIFDPGVTGDPDHGGAGLGLPLARRLARASGGDAVALADGPGGQFRVTLPAG